MNEEDILLLKRLKKDLPKFKPFLKRLELDFLENFDKENDVLEYVKKYSKEYYLLREFFIKELHGIFSRQFNFNRLRYKKIKKYRNLKRYLENEIESTEKDS